MRARASDRGITGRRIRVVGLLLALVTFGVRVESQPIDDTPTPSPTAAVTPTATPQPGVCSDVQACVNQGLTQLVSSCKAASSACTQSPTVFAVTATDIADRALADGRCTSQKVLSKKSRCNACYRAAKAPLRARFGGRLFKGLLAQSVRLIEARRVVACGGVTP